MDAEKDAEGGANILGAFDLDFAALGAGEFAGDGQAQAGAPFGTGAVGPVEAVEEVRNGVFRDAKAGIGDGDTDGGRALLPRAEDHVATRGGVTQGVIDEVRQDLLKAIDVAGDFRDVARDNFEPDIELLGAKREEVVEVPKQLVDLDVREDDFELPGFHPGEVEKALNEPQEAA